MGTDIEALRSLTGSAMRSAATSDAEVAYEHVGRWYQDIYTPEDVESRVVSVDDGDRYEHSENGLYILIQRPCCINDGNDEHKLCNFNDPQRCDPSMRSALGTVKSGHATSSRREITPTTHGPSKKQKTLVPTSSFSPPTVK